MMTNEDKEGLQGKLGLSDGYTEYKKEYIDFLRGRERNVDRSLKGKQSWKDTKMFGGRKKRKHG